MTLELEADSLDGVGMVYDYRRLEPFKGWLDHNLDHRHLNDLLEQPTAERIAAVLYQQARDLLGPRVKAVTVAETPKTSATYRPVGIPDRIALTIPAAPTDGVEEDPAVVGTVVPLRLPDSPAATSGREAA